jgi:hypothetical protein
MATTKQELTERIRLIVQEMQADNAETIVKAAEVLNMMKQIENDKTAVVLPRPCNGPLYDKATLGDHFGKVCEELYELYEAVAQYTNDPDSVKNYDHMCLEATDGITALTTLLEYVKCDESMRQEYQRRVNHSNAVRDGGRRVRK